MVMIFKNVEIYNDFYDDDDGNFGLQQISYQFLLGILALSSTMGNIDGKLVAAQKAKRK